LISVAIAGGKHLFPFRTEPLSPPAPMVLGAQAPGRVGRRRFFDPFDPSEAVLRGGLFRAGEAAVFLVARRGRVRLVVGEIIGAVILGIIAGYLARALVPGKQDIGFLPTVALGVGGALVGYFLFTELLGIGDDDKFDLGGLLGAVIGSIILLLIYMRVTRPSSTPAEPVAPADRKGRQRERDRAREERDDGVQTDEGGGGDRGGGGRGGRRGRERRE
jgi:uncharacterized membrane protein YeaQ/YmgE (transglycosylase-associated protein family)